MTRIDRDAHPSLRQVMRAARTPAVALALVLGLTACAGWKPGDEGATFLGRFGDAYEDAKIEGVASVARSDGKFDLLFVVDSATKETGQIAILKGLTLP